MRFFVWATVLTMALVGLCYPTEDRDAAVHAPAGTSALVSQQLEEGNQLFAQQDWAGAKRCISRTIQTDPTVAEAHYNLALTLEH